MALTSPSSGPGSPADGPPEAAPGAARWSPRQRAMLREMGLRAWPSPAGAPPAPAAAVRPPVGEPSDAAAGTEVAARPAAVPPPPVTAATPREDRREPGPPARPAVPATPPAGLEPAPPARGPRPEGVAAMDWADLATAVAGCRACRLCDGRTRTVFGTGSQEAHWMVVGEAPGEHEDRQGEPFVGKSGQLLDAMLRAIGLSRDAATPAERAAYIANAVKCRPPGNRNPQPDEMAACEPYLIRQVALLRPRIILAMGRFAVQSLLRTDEPIGRLRGRVHRYEGVPLVVTYHPAYLLRNPQDKARAWDDLCRARQAMLGG